MDKNPLKEYFYDLKKKFYSVLCDGYLKWLVSLIEWPAEINL